MESQERLRILSVSYDLALLQSRQMVLETRGYEVFSVEGFVAAIAGCEKANYDLLILGHSIPPDDKQAIIKESKQHSASPILALLRPNEQEVAGATKSIDAAYMPMKLLCTVNELIG